MNNSPELLAAARRTVPSLSDTQWAEWHAQMAAHGGSLVLPFDGSACFATYPHSGTPACQQCAATLAHKDSP